jgi:hypothetical protein
VKNDLEPLPQWKQRVNQFRAYWRRTRNQRRERAAGLKKAGREGLTLAISVLGATLVSYGVWMIYAPAGFIVAGLLLWGVQWNYGNERGNG